MDNGISFTSMADGECLSFMRTRHIYALFSNALDNAVEAVMRVSSPEKRVISLHIRQLSSEVEIAVMNYYEGILQVALMQAFFTMKISAKDSVYLLEIRLNILEKAEKTKGN